MDNPILKQYRRYRSASRDLNNKIIKAFVGNDIIDESARALDLGKDRQLILDREDDMDVLMEFALYEVRRNGMNPVQRYQAEKGGSNHVERELLASMVKTETGLFRIERVSPSKCTLDMRAVVGERTLVLTDIHSSQTMTPGLLVFIRPIVLATFTMTSGIAFVFPETMQSNLRAQWSTDPARRYARLFKLSKSKGMATEYAP